MNTYELASQNIEAWEALPMCYRDDDCLQFFITGDRLICRPSEDQKDIIGDWECEFINGEWVEI